MILAAACGKGPAYGSDNAVIAVVDPEIRDAVEPGLRESLERRVFTTRPEPVFEVTFASSEAIGEFQKWKRIVVVEPADEGATLVEDLLGGDELDQARESGVVAEVGEKWARDQEIWVISGPTADATAQLARAVADSLYRVIHDRYVADEVDRMWASEPDSALADRLLDSLGFSIVLPRVYTPAPGSAPPASVAYYNEDPRRVVSLHWTELPDSVTAAGVLAIRRAWGEAMFEGDRILAELPGAADTSAAAADTLAAETPPILASQVTLGGRPAVRLQGVWQSADGISAGIFLTYGVACGQRLVLLDGNLFAPDRPKYPYLVQLERIFETFRCASDR